MDEAPGIEVVDGLGAEGVDIHGLTADEMFDAPFDLRRTAGIVGAIPGGLAFVAHQGGAALGAALYELDLGPALGGDEGLIDGDNLGNNLAAFLHKHVVAQVEAQLLHEVGIVEGGTPDDGA